MHVHYRWTLGLSTAFYAAAPASAQDAAAAPDTAIAFVNVAVIPMDRERMLERQTVVVRGGRIVAIGAVREIRVPDDAVQVEGTGKYLIPGLGDMHAHIVNDESETPENTKFAERALYLTVAHGVTTIRNMGGVPWVLSLRARAAQGELVSPHIYTAGPIANHYRVPTPAAAVREIERQQAAGYDFLKVYDGDWAPGVFDTLMAAARRAKFPVAGHVPDLQSPTSVPRALAVPYRSMEHLHGYLAYLGAPLDSASLRFHHDLFVDPQWEPGEARLRRMATAIRKAGVWSVPTLTVLETSIRMSGGGAIQGQPSPLSPVAQHSLDLHRRLIRALRDAGAGLLLGTDGPACQARPMAGPSGQTMSPWVMGHSVHFELETLVAAGLTPYEALATSTRNVAEFLGKLGETGTVEVGKRADLVLVDGNPLEDFDRLARPAGVVLGGRWLSREALDAGLVALGLTPDDVTAGKCFRR